MKMLFGNYTFSCRLANEAILPRFKGSTFRGAFGLALKKTVCTLKNTKCLECLLNQRCIYFALFERTLHIKKSTNPRVFPYQHPFVIEPPLIGETHFPTNSYFDFQILLFGETNWNLPYFVYAIEMMGKIGIGKKINGKRGRFTLEKVSDGETEIYSPVNKELKLTRSPEILSVKALKHKTQQKCRIKVNIITPLRLKFQNRFKADLPFHVLVRAMLRRVASLCYYHGEGEPQLDYKNMVKESKDVIITDSKLNWFDLKRYSSRQDRSMLMGGILGSISYEGYLSPFIPIIDFCSKVHCGKQSSFGLGKIKSEIIE